VRWQRIKAGLLFKLLEIMARQYPIYNIINSCAYKQGNKSYGIREHGELNCYVGTSRQRSYKFFNTKTTHKEIKPNLHEYRFYLDGYLIKRALYDYKLDEVKVESFINYKVDNHELTIKH